MKRSRLLVSSTLGLALALLACSGSSVPTTHYYTLGPPSDAAARASQPVSESRGLIVGVSTFTVDPPYDQDRLVYRRGRDSSEVGFYTFHRWASPLDRLIQLAFAEALRGTPGIASIRPASSTGDYSAWLGGRVLYLEQIDRPDVQEARVAVELELTDAAGEVLLARTLAASASGAATSVPEVLQLMDRAIEDLLRQTRVAVAATLDP